MNARRIYIAAALLACASIAHGARDTVPQPPGFGNGEVPFNKNYRPLSDPDFYYDDQTQTLHVPNIDAAGLGGGSGDITAVTVTAPLTGGGDAGAVEVGIATAAVANGDTAHVPNGDQVFDFCETTQDYLKTSENNDSADAVSLADVQAALSNDFHNAGGTDDDNPDTDAEVPDTITVGASGSVANGALDTDLGALGNNSTNGLWARTGSGTGAARTLTSGTTNLLVTNGDGLSGNPSVTFSTNVALVGGDGNLVPYNASRLTNLNGDNVASGTVADARIAATLARDSEVAAAYQPLDATLTDLASAPLTEDNSIDPAAVAAGTLPSDVAASSATASLFYNSTQVRSNLGLAIGTDVQAFDSDLSDLADGSLTGTKVGFSDTDNNFAATNLQAAIEELDDVNASGVNAADGKVDWSQLVNVPGGFADGSDATGAGATIVVQRDTTTFDASANTLNLIGVDFKLEANAAGVVTIKVSTNILRRTDIDTEAELESVTGLSLLTATEGNAAYQPLDSDLTALAGIASAGLLARTGAGTAAARTLTPGTTNLTITNGDGASGNPTVAYSTNVALVGGDGKLAPYDASRLVEIDAGNIASGTLSDARLSANVTKLGTTVTLDEVGGGAAGANAYDFGGATSLEVPNGAAPTVDATGEIALDTTDKTVVAYDGGQAFVVAHATRDFSVTISTPPGGWVGAVIPIWNAPPDMAVTIKSLRVTCVDGTSITTNIEERAFASLGSAGTDILAADVAADTNGETKEVFSNASIAAGAHLVLTPSAVSGSPNYLVVHLMYTEDVE